MGSPAFFFGTLSLLVLGGGVAWAQPAPPPPASPPPTPAPPAAPPPGPAAPGPAAPAATAPPAPVPAPAAVPPAAPPAGPPPAGAPAPPAPDNRPWRIEGWDPDQPAPEGYTLTSSFNTGLIGGGVGVLGGFWIASVIAGAALAGDEKDEGIDGDGIDPKDWSVMYAPVAGPFIAIVNVSPDAAGLAVLMLDGIIQSAGLMMFIGGFIDQDTVAVRYAGGELRVVPGLGGARLEGTF